MTFYCYLNLQDNIAYFLNRYNYMNLLAVLFVFSACSLVPESTISNFVLPKKYSYGRPWLHFTENGQWTTRTDCRQRHDPCWRGVRDMRDAPKSIKNPWPRFLRAAVFRRLIFESSEALLAVNMRFIHCKTIARLSRINQDIQAQGLRLKITGEGKHRI